MWDLEDIQKKKKYLLKRIKHTTDEEELEKLSYTLVAYMRILDDSGTLRYTKFYNVMDKLTNGRFALMRENKIDSFRYNKMPYDYLNVDYNISETNKKLSDILDRVKVLNLEDVVFELKTIISYFDSLYNDFEKEKMAKTKFDEDMKSFDYKLARTTKIVNGLSSQIKDFKNNLLKSIIISNL